MQKLLDRDLDELDEMARIKINLLALLMFHDSYLKLITHTQAHNSSPIKSYNYYQ